LCSADDMPYFWTGALLRSLLAVAVWLPSTWIKTEASARAEFAAS